ncbi:MAG TPA: sigma-70 factor domain-containing protein, partial [Candidatus Binatia bacterium]|nr:sigma-70 factor domain-containing protein [Candidatus Binatia bacterium]
MAEDDKNTELNFSLPELALPKLADNENSEADTRQTALVPFDPLQRYLTEIRRFSLLSREEEHQL